jgi:hypothetical protein
VTEKKKEKKHGLFGSFKSKKGSPPPVAISSSPTDPQNNGNQLLRTGSGSSSSPEHSNSVSRTSKSEISLASIDWSRKSSSATLSSVDSDGALEVHPTLDIPTSLDSNALVLPFYQESDDEDSPPKLSPSPSLTSTFTSITDSSTTSKTSNTTNISTSTTTTTTTTSSAPDLLAERVLQLVPKRTHYVVAPVKTSTSTRRAGRTILFGHRTLTDLHIPKVPPPQPPGSPPTSTSTTVVASVVPLSKQEQ